MLNNSYDFSNIDKLLQNDNIKIDNLYLEGKKEGTQQIKWSINETTYPKISKTMHFFSSVVKGNQYIEGTSLKSLLEKIANDKKVEEHSTLAESKKFTQLARKLGLETEEHRKTRIQTSWHNAVNKSKVIGKGLREDPQAKVLDENYWQEAILPDHQYGKEISKQLDKWKASDTKLDFTAWRQKEGLDKVGKKVKFLSENERKAYEVTFNQGKLQQGETPFNTENNETCFSGKGTAIFVFSPEGKLYAGSHIEGEFHHSSFLAGGAIKSAGEIQTNPEGMITHISTKSGHYKPDVNEMLAALDIFKKQGLDLSKVKVTVQGKEENLVYNNAELFYEKKGELPCDGINQMSFERNEEGKITALYQQSDAMSAMSNFSILEKIKEKGESLDEVTLKENTPWGDVFEYKIIDYLEQRRIPNNWQGGVIHRDTEGNITQIEITKERPNSEFDALNKELQLLSVFEGFGVNLTKTQFVPFVGADPVNAKEYMDQNFPRYNELFRKNK